MKKAFVAVLIIAAAAALIAVAVRRPPAPRLPIAPPPAQPATTASAPAPVEVVTSYLEALQKKNYRDAYDLLSKASQQAHSLDEFVKLNEKGMTLYDLATAKQDQDKQGRTVVSLTLHEDVSQGGFTLAREDGKWKVVFLKGTPSFPYPD